MSRCTGRGIVWVWQLILGRWYRQKWFVHKWAHHFKKITNTVEKWSWIDVKLYRCSPYKTLHWHSDYCGLRCVQLIWSLDFMLEMPAKLTFLNVLCIADRLHASEGKSINFLFNLLWKKWKRKSIMKITNGTWLKVCFNFGRGKH